MGMNLHYILDFETFGQSPVSSPIINCAMFVFDWDRFLSKNPYTFQELVTSIPQFKLNVSQQVKEHGYVLKAKDLDWWHQQGPKARAQIVPLPTDLSLEQFFDGTISYIREAIGTHRLTRWWSRANCFDPVIIQNIADIELNRKNELDEVLPFWLLRDTRTYIDTRFDFKNKKNGFCPIDDEAEWKEIFVMHNSVHDVAADVLRIQKIERTIHL